MRKKMSSPRRILIARGDALGDLVLATVLIPPLKAQFPDAEIYFLARREMVPLLQGIPEVGGVIENPLSYAWKWSEFGLFWELVRDVRRWSPDIFVGVWEKKRYAFLSWFAGVPIRLGYAMSFLHRMLYTHVSAVSFSWFFTHQGVHNLLVLKPVLSRDIYEATLRHLVPHLGCPKAWCDALYAQYPDLQCGYVCVQVDGSAVQKTWLPETMAAVVRTLADRFSRLVLVGRLDAERRQVLQRAICDFPGITDLTDCLDLQQIVVVISRADAFVGLDSGFAHIAGAFHVPSVVYFINRTQNALRWAPIGEKTLPVFSQHDCPDRCVPSVCQKKTCREGLSVEVICASVSRVMSGQFMAAVSSPLRLLQLTVGVISERPESIVVFLQTLGVRVVCLPSDVSLQEMRRRFSESNVMFILLHRVRYKLRYRLACIGIANQVMWQPIVLPIQDVDALHRFLLEQGLSV